MGATTTPLVIGRYGIYDKIASGGMASVHFGRLLGAAGFSRTVAIKKLHAHLSEDPDFMATMIDEARLAARIHHPNVVSTLDVVAEDNELLVVMDYIRGESLSRLLRAEAGRGRRVPLSMVSAITIGALHGLHAAHEAKSDHGVPLGIVHRDVSPQNILVGIDGISRVIDFGVAKAAGRLQTTRDGMLKGKVGYMAPEQLAGSEVTRQADVYAMAVVLWEMLASRRLFQAESDAAAMVKVMAGVEAPPSHYAGDISPELDTLVMTGLAVDARHRFSSAREMAERLIRLVPPAFPTDVGAWVEEVASDALLRRERAVADIESSSGILPQLPPAPTSSRPLSSTGSRALSSTGSRPLSSTGSRPRPTQPLPPPASTDEAATIASHPSALGIQPITPSGPPSPRTSGRFVGVLVGGLAGLAVVAAALYWRGTHRSYPSSAGEVVTATQASPPPEPSGSASPAPPTPSAGAGAATSPQAATPLPPQAPGPGSASASASPVAPTASVIAAAPTHSPTVTARPAARTPTKAPAPAKSAAPFRFAQPD